MYRLMIANICQPPGALARPMTSLYSNYDEAARH
jgi:hypothetical protein